jgi:hypothetical protein
LRSSGSVDYGFFLGAAGFFEDEVVVDAVPEVVVAVVSVFIVLAVSVALAADVVVVPAEPIAPVSVVVTVVPVVPVVSVAELVVAAAPVSAAVVVPPVSVFAFSSFLQPTAKIATAKRATRVTMRDFFISILSFVLFRSI